MRLSFAACVALVLVATTACGSSGAQHAVKRPPRTTLPWWETAPRIVFGRATSLTRLGPGYLLRLDLGARFGPNATGLHACIDNHECRPGTDDFADDTYDHDFHYVVTYYLPPNAPVDLVGGTPSAAPRVSARYFYGMTHGRNPRHVPAMAARYLLQAFAFDVEVGNGHGPTDRWTSYDAVERMAQLYHP